MAQLEKNGWGGVCPDNNQCHVNNTDVTCGPLTGRRKRSADGEGKARNIPYNRTSEIRVSFFVETSWKNFESSNETFYSMEEIQKRIFDNIKKLAENGSFNVGGLDPDIDSFSSGLSDPECPEGTARKQNTMKCVPCSVGTFLDKSNLSQPTCRKCVYN
ncbi:uncharacterized protein LOC134261766 [Saccostrea cucullata]|uniref:uncharacterized protein LOC134261766 n=1 Tax=Saccostrea cuccullata TaxID=36930 RepID=UPI002ECFE81D